MRVDQSIRALLMKIVQTSAASDQQGLAKLVRAVEDWGALIDVAHQHRLLPLLFSLIDEIDALIPPEARQKLRTEYDRNAFHSLANATELVGLFRAFDLQNIPAMPFKGIVLAASVYPNMTIRSAGDLDFLVFEKDLQRATSLLVSRSYELTTDLRDGLPANPNYYELHFERGSDGMVVELRWKLELIQPRFRRDLGMEWVWPRRRSVNVGGVEVPNLDPISTLLILCMHGTKHAWSRMIWVYDVARLLATNPELDWKEAAQDAKQRGLWRSLALGVLLAQRICGAPVPVGILERFAADKSARELAEYFQRNMLENPGQMPRSRVPYSLRILDSGDRVRWALTLDFLKPNERDLAAVRLPNALRPFYFLVRPFRVLFDRSAR
jgi:hypothetical protein